MSTLRIATSRIAYRGEDRLDITRGSGKGLGLLFAPSSAILTPAMAARRHAAILRKAYAPGCLFAEAHLEACREADRIERDAWAVYEPLYLAECERMPWKMLTGLGRVTAVCYCTDAAHCHRTLWRREAVRRLRAVDEGETR